MRCGSETGRVSRWAGASWRWKGIVLAVSLSGMTACATTGPANAAADTKSVSIFDAGENVAGKFLAGRHAESVGDYASAVEWMRDVLDANPGDEKLLVRNHLLLISTGRVDEAIALAARIVVLDENNMLGNMTLALDALSRSDFATALAHLDKVKTSGANRILVPLLRAWVLAGKSDAGLAFDVLDQFDSSGSFTVIASLHGAMIAELVGDNEAAAQAYARAAGATGDGQPLQLVRSFSHFLAKAGRSDQARALAADFAVRHPTNLLIEPVIHALDSGEIPPLVAPTVQAGAAQALHAVADLLHRESVSDSALVFIRLALFLTPDDPAMLSLLGGILRAQQRYDDAIAVFERIAPDTPYAWYAKLDIANSLRAKEDTSSAITLLRGMLETRPERSDAARALGDFLRFEERYDEAVAAYDKAIERVVGKPDWRLHYSRGIALERMKDWSRAEKDFLRALALEPDQPLVLNYLGYSWVEQGTHLDEAKAMIERAVKQRPRDGYITDSLGWVLYRLGDYEGAVRWLEKAVSLAPGDPTINDHLGDAYWLVDRRQEARFQWERALSLDPEPESIDRIRAKIDGKARPQPVPPGERRDI